MSTVSDRAKRAAARNGETDPAPSGEAAPGSDPVLQGNEQQPTPFPSPSPLPAEQLLAALLQQQQAMARQQQAMAQQQQALTDLQEELQRVRAQQQVALPQAAATSAPAAPPAAPTSRFARKEPRTQDLPEYNGAPGAKLDTWLSELNVLTRLFDLNDYEAVSFGSSRFRDAARQWWDALEESGAAAAIADRAALARALRERFQPVTSERLAREQMRALRQGSKPVSDYIAEFQRLRALLPDMSEKDALFSFETGLKEHLQLKLREVGCKSLLEAINLAARVGGLTETSSSRAAASAHQLEAADGRDSEGLEERVARSVLNALSDQGIGAKTQTHRGYKRDRLGDKRAGGGRPERRSYRIPGVSDELREQRRAANQCFRCGSADHAQLECPNAPTGAQGRSLN